MVQLVSLQPRGIINSWSDVEDEREKIENFLEEIKLNSRSVTPSRTLALYIV